MLPLSLGFIHFTWVDLVDIVLVAAIIYALFRWMRGTSALNIFFAILLLIVMRMLAELLNMKMMSALLGTVIDMGALAIIVIFQPEVRRFLENIGRTAGTTFGTKGFIRNLFLRRNSGLLSTDSVNEIVEACMEMGANKTGALLVIRRGDLLDDIAATGDIVDARVSKRLIMNIFFKNSPLHDGAMIIGGGRIVAARCTLPLTGRTDLPAQYGMRHKAAIGMSEQSDADIVVVSEETGKISMVRNGEILTVTGRNNFSAMLRDKKDEK